MSALTKAQIQQAQQLYDTGTSWAAIGRQFGCAASTVRRAIDPEFRRKDNRNHWQRGYASVRGKRDYVQQLSQDDIRAGRAWMQRPDRRDLTAVMFGDPPSGRSALDRCADKERFR